MKIANFRNQRGDLCRLLCLFVFMVCAGSTHAYEQATHEELSEIAFSRSVLMLDPSLYEDLNLNASDEFPNSNGLKGVIYQLIQDGAYFEDAILEGELGENTGGENLRMKHHFYNVQDEGRALDLDPFTLPPLGTKYSSTTWALEDQGDIPRQEFSMKDAYGYFKDALTEQDFTIRSLKWGRTFQSLGHVIHHVQDMAQPQHTRNDAHLPWPYTSFGRRLYEVYTERKRRTNPFPALPYSGHPDIDLTIYNKAKKFWDFEGDGSGRGLAEFSGTNFVSEGTNFTGQIAGGTLNIESESSLPLPDGQRAIALDSVDIQSIPCLPPLKLCVPSYIFGNITFIETPISDENGNLLNANSRASSFPPVLTIFPSNKTWTKSGTIYSRSR